MINELLVNALKNFEKHQDRISLLMDINTIQRILIQEIETIQTNLHDQLKHTKKSINESDSTVRVRIASKLNDAQSYAPNADASISTSEDIKTFKNNTPQPKINIESPHIVDEISITPIATKKKIDIDKNAKTISTPSIHHTHNAQKKIEPQEINQVNASVIHELNIHPIFDLLKEMDLNLRYFFVYELFQQKEDLFLEAINQISALSNFQEAEEWINKNIIEKHKINKKDDHIQSFLYLVKRRFL